MKYIVFDIDGTIADCSHRLPHILQKPKDWDAFFHDDRIAEDIPIDAFLQIARLVRHGSHEDRSYQVVFVTARPERTRAATLSWLRKHLDWFVRDDELIMRPDGVREDDTTLKISTAEKVLGLENILCVFEDRARVVKAWREAGVMCAQVDSGEF